MPVQDRCRSVNDFDTTEGLKAALKSPHVRVAFDETARTTIDSSSIADNEDTVSIASSVEEQQELDWVLNNYNAQLSCTQSLAQELKRLQCLKSYLLLDSPREPSFERLTALASRMFRVPIALVSVVDLGRQWFMSNRGLGDARETPRSLAFCAHAILSTEDLFIINDASQDTRFQENPLVTGPPHIRFYAGAPLTCPEGYKLGTFCIIDSKPRHSGLSLEEKQNLRELAALAVDAMVQRKRDISSQQQNGSQLIACTAHDLLTPLNGVQMSLSLLLEDDNFSSKLTSLQTELLSTATSCTTVMNRICQHAISSFRTSTAGNHATTTDSSSSGHVVISELVQNLQMVMESYPKSVPLYITVDHDVPPVIVSNDLKVFRSALNYLTNACKKTTKGKVHLKISVDESKHQLLWECHDTGPSIPTEQYPFLFRPFLEQLSEKEEDCMCASDDNNSAMNNLGLGLYSVANEIGGMGGLYGFRPRPEGGAIFWFSIPLKLPNNTFRSMQGTHRASYKDLPELAQAQTVQLTREAESLAFKIQTLSNSRSPHSSLLDEAIMMPSDNDIDGSYVHVSHKQNEAQEIETTSRAAMENYDESLLNPNERIRRALVIDDSIVIRKSLSRALSKLGFDVSTAVDGLEGLKDLQSNVYDVVFCDFLMPVMDGLDCVQQYRDWEVIHRPWIQQYIVGISAHASEKDTEKGLSVGMNDFKAKPVTLQILKELESSTELQQVRETLDTILVNSETINGVKHSAPLQVDEESPQSLHKQEKPNHGPVCLVGEHSTSVCKSMRQIMEDNAWNPVLVNDGEDALRLLKMRNWDAVFLDEELPRLDGIRVIERFRAWEKDHRVARQRNVFLISESLVPSPSHGSVSAAYPEGFDSALGKPILPPNLVQLLAAVAENLAISSASDHIVMR
jgi:CheY-like chemotaxis protein/GAF domain-containing protein